MEFAGAMAALTADRRTVKDRRPVTVDSLIHWLRVVAVAEQALHRDRSVRMRVGGKTRRQIPPSFLGIPGDRGFKEVSITIDQVRTGAGPGAQHIVDRGGKLGFRLTARIETDFMMEQCILSPFNQKLQTGRFERIVAFRPKALQRARFPNGRQGPAHRVLPVAGCLVRMTGRTLGTADVFHLDISIGSTEGEARIAAELGKVVTTR